MLSCSVVSDFVTPWTVVYQVLLSVGFRKPEYWSGLLCPPPGDLLDSRIQPKSPSSLALTGGFLTTSATWEAQYVYFSAIFSVSNYASVTPFAVIPQFLDFLFFFLFVLQFVKFILIDLQVYRCFSRAMLNPLMASKAVFVSVRIFFLTFLFYSFLEFPSFGFFHLKCLT